jgi:prophage regulatory protein
MATIWRLPTLKAETGKSRTAIYEDIRTGLMSRPVKIGPRAVGWPSSEIHAIISARIAGKADPEIRALVCKLEAARKAAA